MLPQSMATRLMLGAGAVVLALLPWFVSGYYIELGTYALIAAMLALSLQLLVGCTGLISLGHAAFYGLAAYTVYLITPDGAPRSILVTLPAAVAVAGVVALAVGALSLTGLVQVGWICPLLGLAPAATAWLLAFEDLKAIADGAIEPEARPRTHLAMWLGIAGVIACGAVVASMIYRTMNFLPDVF